jgi:hypothetical protein
MHGHCNQVPTNGHVSLSFSKLVLVALTYVATFIPLALIPERRAVPSAPPTVTGECQICFDQHELVLVSRACAHNVKFCRPCVGKHIEAEVKL